MTKILNIDPARHNIIVSLLIKLLQLMTTVYLKFNRDAGFARAGNLAYNTLLAGIPFAALVISLMSAFGALDSVQNQIMDTVVNLLVPTRQAELKGILDQFLDNSNTLGVVGLVFFALTSIMLLNSISQNLNAVWGSKIKKNFMNKFTTYASVIIFGALLLAASTTISSRFSLSHIENIAILNRLILRLTPFIFDFLVILLIIGLTPSGKIQIRYLLIVSAFGAVFWELMKYGFFNVSGRVLRMSVIYGTIAIIPIFLLWIYIIWMIILVAMETAWVLQHKTSAWAGSPLTEMTPQQHLTFGFTLFMKSAEAYEYGKKPLSKSKLAYKLSASLEDVSKMSDLMIEHKLLMPAGKQGKKLIPARSLTRITPKEVIETIYGTMVSDKGNRAFQQLEIFYTAGISAVEDCTFSEIFSNIDTAQKNPVQ